MSDGISEAYKGTYFSDKSKLETSELEEIKKEMNQLISWGKDLAKAINQLHERIEGFEDSKKIAE